MSCASGYIITSRDQYAGKLASKSSCYMECSPHGSPDLYLTQSPVQAIEFWYRAATATASVHNVTGRPSHSPSSTIFAIAFPFSKPPRVPEQLHHGDGDNRQHGAGKCLTLQKLRMYIYLLRVLTCISCCIYVYCIFTYTHIYIYICLKQIKVCSDCGCNVP